MLRRKVVVPNETARARPKPARQIEAMNEFQAILTIVVYFAVRIGIPALIIYTLARLIRHFQGPELEESDAAETRIAH